MMAALSLADRGLAERLITQTFHHIAPPTDSGADTPAASGTDGGPSKESAPRSEDKAQIIGSVARDKVLGTIEACRDLLSRELPERREHWTNVHPPFPLSLPLPHHTKTHPSPKQRAVIKAQITPLRKKLNKCRDPERWNLVELQRARREQAAKKSDSEDGDPDDRGDKNNNNANSDAAVFGDALPRDPKRRRVLGEGQKGKGLDDPFGGPL